MRIVGGEGTWNAHHQKTHAASTHRVRRSNRITKRRLYDADSVAISNTPAVFLEACVRIGSSARWPASLDLPRISPADVVFQIPLPRLQEIAEGPREPGGQESGLPLLPGDRSHSRCAAGGTRERFSQHSNRRETSQSEAVGHRCCVGNCPGISIHFGFWVHSGVRCSSQRERRRRPAGTQSQSGQTQASAKELVQFQQRLGQQRRQPCRSAA